MIRVASYRKDSGQTYGLGATVVMEYLLHAKEQVSAVILHPQFRSDDTISRIKELCGNVIPVSVEEKPFNILSKKRTASLSALSKRRKSIFKTATTWCSSTLRTPATWAR